MIAHETWKYVECYSLNVWRFDCMHACACACACVDEIVLNGKKNFETMYLFKYRLVITFFNQSLTLCI